MRILEGEAVFLAEPLLLLAAAALTFLVALALVALLTTEAFLVALLAALGALAATFFWLTAFLAEVLTDCLVAVFLADDAGFWMVLVTWAVALVADLVLARILVSNWSPKQRIRSSPKLTGFLGAGKRGDNLVQIQSADGSLNHSESSQSVLVQDR